MAAGGQVQLDKKAIEAGFQHVHPFQGAHRPSDMPDGSNLLSNAEIRAKLVFLRATASEEKSPDLCSLFDRVQGLGIAKPFSVFRAACYRLHYLLSHITSSQNAKRVQVVNTQVARKNEPVIPLLQYSLLTALANIETEQFWHHETGNNPQMQLDTVAKVVSLCSTLLLTIAKEVPLDKAIAKESNTLLQALQELIELEGNEKYAVFFPLHKELLALCSKETAKYSSTDCPPLKCYLALADTLANGHKDIEFGLARLPKDFTKRHSLALKAFREELDLYTAFFRNKEKNLQKLIQVSQEIEKCKQFPMRVEKLRELIGGLRDNLLMEQYGSITERLELRVSNAIGKLFKTVKQRYHPDSSEYKEIKNLSEIWDCVFVHGGFCFGSLNNDMHHVIGEMESFCVSLEQLCAVDDETRLYSRVYMRLELFFSDAYGYFLKDKMGICYLHEVHRLIAKAISLPRDDANQQVTNRLIAKAKSIYKDHLAQKFEDLARQSEEVAYMKYFFDHIRTWDRQFFEMLSFPAGEGDPASERNSDLFGLNNVVKWMVQEDLTGRLFTTSVRGLLSQTDLPPGFSELATILMSYFSISTQGHSASELIQAADQVSDKLDRATTQQERAAIVAKQEELGDLETSQEDHLPQLKIAISPEQQKKVCKREATLFDRCRIILSRLSFSDLSPEEQENYAPFLECAEVLDNFERTVFSGVLRFGRELSLLEQEEAERAQAAVKPKLTHVKKQQSKIYDLPSEEEAVAVSSPMPVVEELDMAAGGRFPCEVEITRSLEPLLSESPSISRAYYSIPLLLHQPRVESPHRYSHAAALATGLLLEGVLVHRLGQTGGVPDELVGTHRLSDMASVLNERGALDKSLLPLINSFDRSIASKLGRCQPNPHVEKFSQLEDLEQTVERARRDLLVGMQLVHQLLGHAPVEFLSPRLECSVEIRPTPLQVDIDWLEQNFGEAIPLAGESLLSQRVRNEHLRGAFVHLIRAERALSEPSTPTYVDIKSRLFSAVKMVESASTLVYCHLPIRGDSPHSHVAFTTLGESRVRELRHSHNISALYGVIKDEEFQLSDREEKVLANFSRFCSHEHSYADETSASSVGRVMLELENLERLKQAYTFGQGFIEQDLESLSQEFKTVADIDKKLIDLNKMADNWVKELKKIAKKITERALKVRGCDIEAKGRA